MSSIRSATKNHRASSRTITQHSESSPAEPRARCATRLSSNIPQFPDSASGEVGLDCRAGLSPKGEPSFSHPLDAEVTHPMVQASMMLFFHGHQQSKWRLVWSLVAASREVPRHRDKQQPDFPHSQCDSKQRRRFRTRSIPRRPACHLDPHPL